MWVSVQIKGLTLVNRNFMCSCFLSVAAFLLLGSAALRAEWLQGERELMGTQVSVELWVDDKAAGQRLMQEVFAEVRRLDLMMNPWNDASELARINRDAGQRPVAASPEIIAVVQKAKHYSELSDGAFDISFASVGQHYNYRDGVKPSEQMVAADLPNIDFRAIELSAGASKIHFIRPELQIDLGGIAKGYAVDRGILILQKAGVKAAAIGAGGDSRILGDMGDRPRTVGIRHPRKPGEYVVLMPLADTAISTSGDYERYFEAEGVRYHHILDPKTGVSAAAVQSVSILAPSAIDSDALSTTTFVLGVERGLALINRLPGVDAIIIDGQGKLHYSQDLLRSSGQ